jgi:hypothetical protein
MKKLLAILIMLLSFNGIINADLAMDMRLKNLSDPNSNSSEEQKAGIRLEIKRAIDEEQRLLKQEAQQYNALAQTAKRLLDKNFVAQIIKNAIVQYIAQNPIDAIQRNQAIELINLMINSSKAETAWKEGRKQREIAASVDRMSPEQQDDWYDNEREKINNIRKQSDRKFASFYNAYIGLMSEKSKYELFEAIGQAIIDALQQTREEKSK